MASNKKIWAIGCIGIAVVMIVMLVVFWSVVGTLIGLSNKEHNRVSDLPDIYGVVYTDSVFLAPISGKPAALCFIKSRAHIYRMRHDSENDIPVPNPHLKIKVGDKYYRLKSQARVLSRIKGDREGKSWSYPGFMGADEPIPPGLTGISDIIDCGIQGVAIQVFGKKLDLQPHCGPNPSSISLKERIFLPGDSISFKGKIEGDEIVPLF